MTSAVTQDLVIDSCHISFIVIIMNQNFFIKIITQESKQYSSLQVRYLSLRKYLKLSVMLVEKAREVHKAIFRLTFITCLR